MDELEKRKVEAEGLRQELRALRETHDYVLLELADARENELKYKQLSDTLAKGLESNHIDLAPLKNIHLSIKGEFGCPKCLDLEHQLDSYRSGVNMSVERRVKEIARNFSGLQEEERRKSRVSSQPRQCSNCLLVEREAAAQREAMEQTLEEYEERAADREILTAKLSKMQALLHNLEEENSFLEAELRKLQSRPDQCDCGPERHFYNEYNGQGSHSEKQRYCNENEWHGNGRERQSRASLKLGDKSNKMMQEITCLVSNLSNRKAEESRRKSRVYQPSDNSFFSIKDGINRPSLPYY